LGDPIPIEREGKAPQHHPLAYRSLVTRPLVRYLMFVTGVRWN